MLHLCQIIRTFHYNYLNKPTTMSLPINFTPLLAQFIVKLKPRVEALTKQNFSKPTKTDSTSKHAKKNWNFSFYIVFGLVLIASTSSIFNHIPAVWYFLLARFSSNSLTFSYKSSIFYSPFGFSSWILARKFLLSRIWFQFQFFSTNPSLVFRDFLLMYLIGFPPLSLTKILEIFSPTTTTFLLTYKLVKACILKKSKL